VIIGKTGSGKSLLLRHLFTQLMEKQGVGLFDPHGDLLEAIIQQIPETRILDTVFIDPTDQEYPIAFNVLNAPEDKREQAVSAVVDTFQKLFETSWGPRTDYILSHAISALSYVPNASLLGVQKLLMDGVYRKECLKYLKDPILREFWEKEYKAMPARLRIESIAPLLNKVNRFLMVPMMRNILGQKENRIDLRSIMDSGKILLMNLPKGILGEENSRLLGNFFLAHLQIAALSRADTLSPQRKQFTVFVDELQHFVESPSSLTTILTEGRKYRINLVLACQHLSQLRELSDTIFGNISTLMAFNVAYEDAKTISPYLEKVEPSDLINLPPHHGYMRIIQDNVPHIVSFQNFLLPRDSPKHSIKEEILKHSRENFARSRKEVEKEIRAFFQTISHL
jgi:hypothetical protein